MNIHSNNIKINPEVPPSTMQNDLQIEVDKGAHASYRMEGMATP